MITASPSSILLIHSHIPVRVRSASCVLPPPHAYLFLHVFSCVLWSRSPTTPLSLTAFRVAFLRFAFCVLRFALCVPLSLACAFSLFLSDSDVPQPHCTSTHQNNLFSKLLCGWVHTTSDSWGVSTVCGR
ncbi:hypothetical protein L227DRAFT_436892 [Lentinus tigrinus ALCF2SS1-6]|uniref:Uncharacterized protein n=1 Tax=Lentinus tigrinus ALCF2SS1-6 TaxID=1328759 RepID=A0A5C2SGL9_9APHY|nr:hypothetical protein L227DRAFT_436892 [Lentinus tigrinus ALCF2SS1-6]